MNMITILCVIAVSSSLNSGELDTYLPYISTNGIAHNLYDIAHPQKLNNDSCTMEKPFDEDYHVLFDPSTGKRSHSHYNYMLEIIQHSLNNTYSQESNPNKYNDTSAYSDFALCLEVNRDELKVKDLKDIYRIRGIPKSCCSSLATALLPIELMEMFEEDKGSNCRINSLFVPNGGFDPHTHPLYFASIIIAGGYTHTYLEKEKIDTDMCLACNPMFDEICTEHNRIYRKNDTLPLEYHGTVKLYKTYQESFISGDIIVYDDNESIHIIEEYLRDTITVNWVTTIGDNEIDVFTDHQSPFRTVLTKPDTRNAMKGPLSSAIIDKNIAFFI